MKNNKRLISLSSIFLALIIMLCLCVPSVYAWDTNPHKGMAGRIGDVYCYGVTWIKTTLENACEQPDWWGQDATQDHVYLLDVPLWPNRAPSWCDTFATTARDLYSQGQYSSAVTNLGYATHYCADVANPAHTSATGASFHNAYEPYVGDEWTTGNCYQNDLAYSSAGFYTPSECVIRTATNAYRHVGTLDYIVAVRGAMGYNWEIDSAVTGATHDTIHVGSQYVNSLYYRMIGFT